ncbi:3'(2'),5'-bisphosphate nucleotidase [Tieghemiomyces parasiticus]|uniref:3'(2'),5'-bisphosphate nucleotidase n=1 Tax=Tieghemiomyces parasiticus TaxID=78921 RepID=A0A9W8DY37_9FUNG|nr:3'(2'),5'-bisphosphate nucleotidase [Tieghemiomyces parasiticus]
MSATLAAERRVAVEAVLQACRVCQKVFNHLVAGETIIKDDRSPVTVADYSAQAVVNTYLAEHFPQDLVVGEESARDLQGEVGRALREKVLSLSNAVLRVPLTESKLLTAIDRGSYGGGPRGRHWTLDPIDGTKGFLRGDQFAVCLALIEDGEVRLGVMGCPNLPAAHLGHAAQATASPPGERGCLFIAEKGHGAFTRSLVSDVETRIHVSDTRDCRDARFCESVEAAHSSHSDASRVGQDLGITQDSIRMDSQCKYGCIARGDADIYLRLPASATYVEKIWDHASGALLVEEAGGIVTDVDGKHLDFSRGRFLDANRGVVAANAQIHSEVLRAVQKVLQNPERA